MSISGLNNENNCPEGLPNDIVELSCLNEKIYGLIHRINSAQLELREAYKSLNRIVIPEHPIIQDLKKLLFDLFGISLFGRGSSDLLIKIDNLQALRDFYHKRLNTYEKQLSKCLKVFEKYEAYLKPLEIAYTEEMLKDSDTRIEDCVLIQTLPGITIQQMAPAGVGADPILASLTTKAEKIFEKAMSCRLIKELYIEAMLTPDSETDQIGPWTLLLLDNDHIPENIQRFGGSCAPHCRSIIIDAQKSDEEILSTFVFELTNATSSKEFHKLDQATIKGEISREDYAKSIERIEHQGLLRQCAIMDFANKKHGWGDLTNSLDYVPRDFDIWWDIIKDGAHTESYRDAWDRYSILQPAHCHKRFNDTRIETFSEHEFLKRRIILLQVTNSGKT